MDLRQLRYLVTVVHERSLSRAAEQLLMTQPPLSTAMAQLERELGVPLLDRHSRGVEPTEAGQYLVDRAVEVLAEVDDIAASVRAVGTGRRGRLSVSIMPAMAWELLPELLRAFVASSPDVVTEVRDAVESDVVAQVRDRVSDVGLVYCSRTTHLERLVARDLEVAMIRSEPLVAVLPVAHRAAKSGPGTLGLVALKEDRWILPTGNDGFPGLVQTVRDAWEKTGITPTSRCGVSSWTTGLRLVEAGLGVTMMPSSVASVAGQNVAVVSLTDALAPIEAAVIWRRHERQSPVLSLFLRAALWTLEPDRLGPGRSRPPRFDE